MSKKIFVKKSGRSKQRICGSINMLSTAEEIRRTWSSLHVRNYNDPLTLSIRTAWLFRSKSRHRPNSLFTCRVRKAYHAGLTGRCDAKTQCRWVETSTSLIVCKSLNMKSLTWSNRCLERCTAATHEHGKLVLRERYHAVSVRADLDTKSCSRICRNHLGAKSMGIPRPR